MATPISTWTTGDLQRFIQNTVRTTAASLPKSLALAQVEVEDKLLVKDLLELSPQALAYLRNALYPDTGWAGVTFTNSWAQMAGRMMVGYRKVGSVVYLRGSLWGGASGTSAFTLPAGFLPSLDIMPAGGYYAPDTGNTVLIGTGGTVQIYWGTASQAALDGISFLID